MIGDGSCSLHIITGLHGQVVSESDWLVILCARKEKRLLAGKLPMIQQKFAALQILRPPIEAVSQEEAKDAPSTMLTLDRTTMTCL
jgi:hypothetical protein